MSTTTIQTAGKTANDVMGTMRLSLIAARKLNNKKAISRDFVSGNPKIKDPDKVFEAWCKAVADIYKAIEPWAVAFHDATVKDEDLQKVYMTVVPMWTSLATDVDPKMFVRPNDVHRIVGFTLSTVSTSKGTTDYLKSITSFRKDIETMMGVRIAQSAVLTEEEADLVKRYDKTVANMAKAQARLDGSTNSKGEHKAGLLDNLTTAQSKLDEVKKLAMSLGVKEDELDDNELIKGYSDAVDDIESNINKTKKKISEYKDYIKDNTKKYKEILKKINEVTE